MVGNITKEEAEKSLDEMLLQSTPSASPYLDALKKYYETHSTEQESDIEKAAAKLSKTEGRGFPIGLRQSHLRGPQTPGIALLMKAHEANRQDDLINAEGNGVTAATVLRDIQDAEKKRAGAETRDCNRRSIGFLTGGVGLAIAGLVVSVVVAVPPIGIVLTVAAIVYTATGIKFSKGADAANKIQNADSIQTDDKAAEEQLNTRRAFSAKNIENTGKDVSLEQAYNFNKADSIERQNMATEPEKAKPKKPGCWLAKHMRRTSVDMLQADPVPGRY